MKQTTSCPPGYAMLARVCVVPTMIPSPLPATPPATVPPVVHDITAVGYVGLFVAIALIAFGIAGYFRHIARGDF